MGSAVIFQQFGLAGRGEAPPAAPQPEPAELPQEDASEDPEAVRLAALERLAGTLEALTDDQARLRDGLIGAWAQALGEAAEAMLPALAREAFAARVAELVAGIAGRGDWPELTLSLAPDDRPAIEQALAAHGAIAGLALAEDAGLEPGEAQVGWPAGGARIDVHAIAEAALKEFRQRLAGLASTGD